MYIHLLPLHIHRIKNVIVLQHFVVKIFNTYLITAVLVFSLLILFIFYLYLLDCLQTIPFDYRERDHFVIYNYEV